MIGTLVWKEYREHRAVWVALAALAGIVVGGLTQFLGPPAITDLQTTEFLVVLVVVLGLAGTYGLVCGSMLFAGEREAGTLGFLDTQPVARLQLWGVKLLFGVLLTLGQVVFLAVLVRALGLTTTDLPLAGWFAMLLAVALESFAWSLVSSALCRGVLAAAGLTSLFLAGAWILGGVVFWPPTPWLVLIRTGLAIVALAGSAAVFCGPDLLRKLTGRSAPAKTTVRVPHSRSAQRILWLCLRQGRWLIFSLSFPSVLCGLLLPQSGVVVWPGLTLVVGILCGVAVFAGDQPGQAYRFYGDQRLPVGQIWTMKTALWASVAILMAVLALLGGGLHVMIHYHLLHQGKTQENLLQKLFGPGKLVEVLGQGLFLSLWLAYGFAVGQVFGLLRRKSAVALVLAVLVSAAMLGIWVPSLLLWVGVRPWLLLAIPAFLLLASRLAVWSWASDRLGEVRFTVGLLGCVLVITAWLAWNLTPWVWERPQDLLRIGLQGPKPGR